MTIITGILNFLNEQILRMEWLSYLISILIEKVFRLDMTGKIGASLHFFIYDVIKIFILLSVLIYVISYLQSYFPPERTKKILGKFKGIKGNILGALLGTITPFCSCSSIPIFIGFTGAGLPIGITFSFLISSPLVDLASLVLLASIFNWRIAILYVITGVILAVIGGTLIDKWKLEKYVEPFVMSIMPVNGNGEDSVLGRKERLDFARDQVKSIVGRVWLYILIGVGIGALIHDWLPTSFIDTVLGKENVFSVLIATLIGIPMYADIFGTLPIAEALIYKGVGLGTALALMMAVTALSLPSLILLKKVVKIKLLAIFALIVTVGILIIGYTFNAFAYLII